MSVKKKVKYIPLLEVPVPVEKPKPVIIKAKTDGQQDLIDAIDECQIIICAGPAGSGKTFLPLGKGFEGLKTGKYEKLILVRPLQECGKEVGFLPGNLDEKIAPHIKAFTELYERFVTKTELIELIKQEKLVIETLEFLRGRTLNNSFVIVDEAQNCEYKQLKMVLTRIGRGSKMVLCGDLQQTDLPEKYWKDSEIPLSYVMNKLELLDVPNIGILELTEDDIVRHGIIKLICKALP